MTTPMNDPMILAAAAVLIIGALATGVVSIITALSKMKGELLTKVATVSDKAVEIHDLVNGNAHEAAKRLAALEAQIAQLHERLAASQEQRATEAQARGSQ